MSADGTTALVGGPNDDEVTGAVWAFTFSGSTWTQQGPKLTGAGASGAARVGWSVAVSSDGNTALVGGFSDDGSIGAVWVFARSGATWAQQGEKLTGGGEAGNASFGDSVALSSDGNTALVGGPGDGYYGYGAAWVFTRSGSTWTQRGEKLAGSGEAGFSQFGSSVALSSDGNTALVGGQHDNNGAGAAWVFTRSGPTWTQQGEKLTGSGETGEGYFGSSVALSPDGNTALVGGPLDRHYNGAAWLFTRSGSSWTQQGEKLTGADQNGQAEFGCSVALSSEGNIALVGGYNDNSGLGAAWVFSRSGSTWPQLGTKLTGSGESGLATFNNSR